MAMLRLSPKFCALLAGTLLLIVPRSAHAETPGEMLVPRAGVTFTRRTVGTVTRTNQAEARFEQIRQINVVSSDGWTALVHLTPVTESSSAADTATTMVDSPDNTVSYFAFLAVGTSFQMTLPGNKNNERTALFRTTLDCGKAALRSFLPIGRVRSITTRCVNTTAQDGVSRPPEPVLLTLIYEGRRELSVAAGRFRVREVRVTREGGVSRTDELISIDDETGVIVKSETKQFGQNFETRTTGELIALTR